tara:strand:+ start:344 stop:1765 length:1422 start_codon:yes stop_codon:yes gene_type:complete
MDINLNPYTAESAAIQRKLQMAQLLNQQAMQPLEMPQQAGVKISPYAGLAKILEGFNASQQEKSATQAAKDLAEKYQKGSQADIASFLQARLGSQTKELAGPAPQGAPQGISSEGMEGGYIQPAQAPDVNRAMAIALGSQNPSLQAAGGAMLSQMTAQDKIKDFKVELVGDKTHRIGYTETGKRIDLGPITESVSPDTAARLKQDKEISDRTFGQLSASQKATLANEAARIGISAQQLFFDTGIKAGGGAFVNPIARPAQPTAPTVAPALTPNAVPVAAPQNTSSQAYTPLGQLSPKAQQEIEKARIMETVVPKPLTEAQGNATAFGMRMAESNKLLNALESKGVTNTGLIRQAIGGAVGLTPFVGEKLQSAVKSSMNPLPGILGGPSSGQQEYDQAKQNFITAVLRKESGAAIGVNEFKTEDEKYFPQAGDTDKVIKQKQTARELAIKAMGIQAGPQGARNIAPQGDPLGLR